jgi:membrane-associated phospholipid phosphatase
MSYEKTFPRKLIILLTFSLTVMGLLTFVDYEWTLWLRNNRIQWWADFTSQTLFEGDPLGGSDFGMLFMLIPILGYFLSYKESRFEQLQRWRPYLGFLLFSGLGTGLGIVHSLKWVMGRARPYLVIRKGIPYTNWFEFGPLHISDGPFFGSMPSGHTATAILLITLAYILAADRTHLPGVRIAGWIWGLISIIFAISMAVGRSMTLHHWLTDGIGIILIDWIAVHLIFFSVLKVPQQMTYFRTHGYLPEPLRYWELRLLWRLLVIVLAVMAGIIGIKAIVFQKGPMLILMLIPALVVGYIMTKNLMATYRIIMTGFITESRKAAA